MTGVVIDTNIVVSANLIDEGLPAFVVSLALNEQVQLYISEPILEEYRRVLSYPRLKFLPQDIERFLAKVVEVAKMVVPTHTVDKCGHEPDNRFLECAEAAGADYLVTGNTRHFPKTHKKTKIVTARQLIDLLAAAKE